METDSECFLCVEERDPELTRWTDRALRHDRGVGSLIAGVGAQRTGYCLISPTQHVQSTCSLTDESLRLFAEFFATQARLLVNGFGSLTYWEHGGNDRDERTSACIEHAHVHVLPGTVPLTIAATGLVRYGDVDSWWYDAERWRGRPYVMYAYSDGSCVVGQDPGIPQYFRRQVAYFIRRDDEWDYAACPNYGVVAQTIDAVRRLPA